MSLAALLLALAPPAQDPAVAAARDHWREHGAYLLLGKRSEQIVRGRAGGPDRGLVSAGSP